MTTNHTYSPRRESFRPFRQGALRLCLAMLLLAMAAIVLPAQTGAPADVPRRPLGEILNPDGTLSRDALRDGAIDPQGWRMIVGEDGAPRFVRDGERPDLVAPPPSRPGDEFWDEGFGGFKMDGNVYAMAVYASDIYIGGAFDRLGESAISRLARWDGFSWTEVGGGVDGYVYTLVADYGRLYVGGQFKRVGNLDANNIAIWNNTSGGWSTLNSGVTAEGFSYVSAIAVQGDDLYVGGSFTHAGGSPASNIARWNLRSSGWSTLGAGGSDGTDGEVLAIATKAGQVYVGGSFNRAGTTDARNIALWNSGSRAWSELGEGVNGFVNAIGIARWGVYVGGGFDTAGTAPATGFARWSTVWRAAGELDGAIRQIVVSGSYIYVAGEFRVVTDSTITPIKGANHVAVWGRDTIDALLDLPDTAPNKYQPTWTTLGNASLSGVNGYTNAIAVSGDRIYLGGSFRLAGGEIRGRVVQWDTTAKRWRSFGFNVSGPVHAFAVRGHEVYVAGTFEPRVGESISTIVKWDGRQWSIVESGIDGNIYAMAFAGDDLYVGGRFKHIGSTRWANNLAYYSAASKKWNRLDTGVRNPDTTDYAFVSAIVPYGDNIYIGGYFAYARDVLLNQIGVWNRNTKTWSPLRNGVSGVVRTIAIDSSGVPYIGGAIAIPGDTDAFNLARWDGSRWVVIGGGVWGSVATIAFRGSDLFVGGTYRYVGSDSLNIRMIARWDGTSWHGLGAGIEGDNFSAVNSILFDGSDIYAAGYFRIAGNDSASHIARWDGSRWWPLGSGTDDIVYAMTRVSSGIYVGGRFITAGDKPSYYFGRWNMPTLAVEAKPAGSSGAILSQNAPNPFAERTTISFTLARPGHTSLKVFNARGEEIATLVSGPLPSGAHYVDWNAKGMPAGAYFYRLEHEGDVTARTLLLAR